MAEATGQAACSFKLYDKCKAEAQDRSAAGRRRRSHPPVKYGRSEHVELHVPLGTRGFSTTKPTAGGCAGVLTYNPTQRTATHLRLGSKSSRRVRRHHSGQP